MAQDIYAQAHQEFQCDHNDVALRRRTVQVAGKPVQHIWRQCMRCGKGLTAIKKHPLSSAAEAELELYDEELAGLWRQRWQARLDELRRQKSERQEEDWWARYAAYLQTPQWQERRSRVLARDGHVCQGCLGAEGLPAAQAHHLSYDHLGAEFLWELIAVCRVCHERLHGRPLAGAPVHDDRLPDRQTAQHVEAALRERETSLAAARQAQAVLETTSG